MEHPAKEKLFSPYFFGKTQKNTKITKKIKFGFYWVKGKKQGKSCEGKFVEHFC